MIVYTLRFWIRRGSRPTYLIKNNELFAENTAYRTTQGNMTMLVMQPGTVANFGTSAIGATW